MLRNETKSKKFAKIFVTIATTAIMMAIFGLVCFAAGEEGFNADSAWDNVLGFFVKWFERIGMAVGFIGGIMFAFAIKNDVADRKQTGLVTMVSGFVVFALCVGARMFGLSPNENASFAIPALLNIHH